MINQITNNSQPLGTNKTALTPEQSKLKKTCSEFEAIMIRRMLEVMNSSTKLFGKGFGGDFYQSMFLDEIAQKAAEQGLGLSDMLYTQIEKSINSK